MAPLKSYRQIVNWRVTLGILHFFVASVLIGSTSFAEVTPEISRSNILFITVDDMSCDSVGVFGCKLKNTTPHMDRLASQGLRFAYAHVQVGNCMPSRNVMWSGRYPHSNKVEGFYQVKNPDYPVLADLMQGAGYFAGIRGKVSHSTPYRPYAWDADLTMIDGQQAHMKDPESYYESTKRGIAQSKNAGKPFCINVNISDPHKPFYSGPGDRYQPTATFTPEEVPIPGFLFAHPDVRRELALYYSSVRRADDCVGEILRALEESGHASNTVVMFLSDHGMPLPFAKTQIYHHSTHTPWIVRWPGVVKPGTVDDRHMISAIDALPTLLDIAGIKHPSGLQGLSFLPLLKGKPQDGRDMIFKEYNENAGGGRHPMRGVQTRKYGYIFNPWSDGQRSFKTATKGTATYRTMQELAETDKKIAARLKLFDHRVREEFYDYEKDPDALHNLIDDPSHQTEIQRARMALEDWMVRTGDHALEAFRNRDDDTVIESYMTRVEKESADRRANSRRAKQRAKNPKRKQKTKTSGK